MEDIKILIADDQRLIPESLQIVIESRNEGLVVVGIAKDGADLIEVLKKVQADVILMDIRMPNMDGIEATRHIMKEYPDIKIIMLTTFFNRELVQKAMDAGAVGYLEKDISTDELIHGIIAAKHGVFPISPKIAAGLQMWDKDIQISDTTNRPAWMVGLDEREIMMLQLLKQGHTNKEIGIKMFLAEQTVKNYLSRLYKKMGAGTRSEAKCILENISV